MIKSGDKQMGKKDNISSSVIQRLPRYYRFLSELEKEGITHVNSGELAQRMRSTASQVRQDFNCFGEFGQQGIGYSVKGLTKEIENILGLKNRYPAILIGAGNIGTAIANQLTFENKCFQLIGIFDNDENKIGSEVAGLTVQSILSLDEFCKNNHVETAVLCVPKTAAAELAHQLYKLGIKSYWNFSHYDLKLLYPDIVVENVHLSDSIMQLCFRITQSTNIDKQ